MNNLQLFSQPGCSACETLKKFLNSLSVHYTEVNIMQDRNAARLMVNNNLKTVPQIFLNNQLFVRGGYKTIVTMRKQEILDQIELLGE